MLKRRIGTKICIRFCRTAIFDLRQYCNPLIFKDANYLIWKSSTVLNVRVSSQEHSNTIKAYHVGSKLPHLHNAYLLSVCKQTLMTVHVTFKIFVSVAALPLWAHLIFQTFCSFKSLTKHMKKLCLLVFDKAKKVTLVFIDSYNHYI